jgi:hypothetical protein
VGRCPPLFAAECCPQRCCGSLATVRDWAEVGLGARFGEPVGDRARYRGGLDRALERVWCDEEADYPSFAASTEPWIPATRIAVTPAAIAPAMMSAWSGPSVARSISA